jgi:hypothetical protein
MAARSCGAGASTTLGDAAFQNERVEPGPRDIAHRAPASAHDSSGMHPSAQPWRVALADTSYLAPSPDFRAGIWGLDGSNRARGSFAA